MSLQLDHVAQRRKEDRRAVVEDRTVMHAEDRQFDLRLG